MAARCIWVQRGVNDGDIHISESGFKEQPGLDKARTAVCDSCGTEVGKAVGSVWFERVRMRRGGDRYKEASPTFLEQLRAARSADSGSVVEESSRPRKVS